MGDTAGPVRVAKVIFECICLCGFVIVGRFGLFGDFIVVLVACGVIHVVDSVDGFGVAKVIIDFHPLRCFVVSGFFHCF